MGFVMIRQTEKIANMMEVTVVWTMTILNCPTVQFVYVMKLEYKQL
jgi:hypothetical protein